MGSYLDDLKGEINKAGLKLGIIVFIAIFLAMLAALTVSKKL